MSKNIVPTKAEFEAFMEGFKAYDLKDSTRPFKLVSLKKDDKLWEAVRTMLHKRVSSVAVFDAEKAQFSGFLDILDVASVIFLLNFANALVSGLENEPTWGEFSREELKVLNVQKIGDLANASERSPWVEVKFQDSVRHAFLALCPNNARRIAVKDAGNAGIECVVSQWDAVRWLQRMLLHAHFFPTTKFVDIVNPAIKSARVGRKLVTLDENMKTMDAFSKLTEEHVTGGAVVDKDNVLVGVLSASDFLRTHRNDSAPEWGCFFDDLKAPVKEYLSRRNNYFPGQFSKHPIVLDEKRDTVQDALNKFTANHIHRLFVVDELFHPIGVWSLSDVIEVFLRYNGVAEKKKKKKKSKKSKNKDGKKKSKKSGKKDTKKEKK